MKDNTHQNYENLLGPIGCLEAATPPLSYSAIGWDELPLVEPEALAAATNAFEREQMERWQEREQQP
jgi:hypothetical protein